MAERCYHCDRADCPDFVGANCERHNNELESIRIHCLCPPCESARQDCQKHYVEWRTRALAAEAELARLREATRWRSVETEPPQTCATVIGWFAYLLWPYQQCCRGADGQWWRNDVGCDAPTHWAALMPPPEAK